MTLRRRIDVYRYGLGIAFVLVAVVTIDSRTHVPFVAVPIVGLTAWLLAKRVGMLVARSAFRRFSKLVDAERYDDARRLLSELRELYAGQLVVQEQLRFYEASILHREGRNAEAATLLESIDRKTFGENWLPWLLNNLAFCLAEAGRGTRAVLLARESITAAQGVVVPTTGKDDLRACQLGTLGAALVVNGDAAEAVEPLEQAIVRGGRPRQQAARFYYLGEALRALGHDDQAAASYQSAILACPKGRATERARQRLAARSPYRDSP